MNRSYANALIVATFVMAASWLSIASGAPDTLLPESSSVTTAAPAPASVVDAEEEEAVAAFRASYLAQKSDSQFIVTVPPGVAAGQAFAVDAGGQILRSEKQEAAPASSDQAKIVAKGKLDILQASASTGVSLWSSMMETFANGESDTAAEACQDCCCYTYHVHVPTARSCFTKANGNRFVWTTSIVVDAPKTLTVNDYNGAGDTCPACDAAAQAACPTPVPSATAAPIPCNEKIMGAKGVDYRGCQTVTTGGNVCQEWSSQTPHQHGNSPELRPTFGLVGNRCRNPDNSNDIWCYTVNPDVEWEYCEAMDRRE